MRFVMDTAYGRDRVARPMKAAPKRAHSKMGLEAFFEVTEFALPYRCNASRGTIFHPS